MNVHKCVHMYAYVNVNKLKKDFTLTVRRFAAFYLCLNRRQTRQYLISQLIYQHLGDFF